jgi:hypothetical protein
VEQLVIRFGCDEVIRNPTITDVQKVMDDIRNNDTLLPECSIENTSNCKSSIGNSKEFSRCVLKGKYVTLSKYSYHDLTRQPGWVVTCHDDEDNGFFLLSENKSNSKLVEGICYGGILAVRTDCIVSFDEALHAIAYFLEERDRSPKRSWLEVRAALRMSTEIVSTVA